MDLGLKGLNALITGGSKGIGQRCADLLAREGANVSICARNASEVETVVADLQTHGTTCFGAAVDVSDKGALEAWVA
ncbi:MAG: SDR family NAD(P)-dependent oxidoreductase, partial [Pseudomonadota bacterium]